MILNSCLIFWQIDVYLISIQLNPALVLGRIYDAFIGLEPINGVKAVGILDVDGNGEEYGFPTEWFEVAEILE